MQPLSLHELRCLLALMHRMQSEASAGHWHELSELDLKRRELLVVDKMETKDSQTSLVTPANTFLKNTNISRENTSDYAELKKEITTLNQNIINTVQTARQRLLDENRVLTAQQKAKKNYALTSTF